MNRKNINHRERESTEDGKPDMRTQRFVSLFFLCVLFVVSFSFSEFSVVNLLQSH